MDFELISDYQPTGDQPEAIAQLTEGIRQHVPAQTLLGVTGSGKTFTIANVIKNINKPTLILSHNKTLAAQLYGEFKNFFPHNAVEYYVSYYDYYQPEAYLSLIHILLKRSSTSCANFSNSAFGRFRVSISSSNITLWINLPTTGCWQASRTILIPDK